MTYNERVQSLAEKMGKVQQHLRYESDLNEVKWEQLTTMQRHLLIIKSKAVARIAVSEMAKLLTKYYRPLKLPDSIIIAILKDEGLIPDQQEAEKL